ncbi:MAG: TetR/AcrR family transcriptional regulator [Caulobacterales bacterium]
MKRGSSSAPAAVHVDEMEAVDGRRARSSRSRAEIIRAMIDIIREGDLSPSAARVAEVAGVSLRTVFRHFDDVDSLYREMTAIVEQEVRPLASLPIEGRTWRERLDCMLERRLNIFERIAPFRVAGSLRRYSSTFLMEDHQRFIRLERASLIEVLPKKVVGDATLLNALELASGFQAWRRLRQDQMLSVDEARAAILLTVESLLADK